MSIGFKTKRKGERRPPFAEKPLRDPGQSLQEKLYEVVDQEYATPATLIAMVWVYALMEAFFWYSEVPRLPVVMALIAVLVTIHQGLRIRRSYAQIDALRLGRDGERVVGQLLDEKLRPRGYHVIHDLCEDGYNIDHVIVGPGGVFAVDTKTHSKPKGNPKVDYDGKSVWVNGRRPDRDPIAQARAVRDRVRQILNKRTGRSVFVRGVVVYPGWYVTMTVPNPDVWVMNPIVFVRHLRGLRAELSPEDVTLFTSHLKDQATRGR